MVKDVKFKDFFVEVAGGSQCGVWYEMVCYAMLGNALVCFVSALNCYGMVWFIIGVWYGLVG